MFAIDNSSISCISCSAGYYADRTTNSCAICGPGFYSTGPTSSCSQCPNGSTTMIAGSKSKAECIRCLPGTALSSDPRTGNLRLVGGKTKHEGRVEVYNPTTNSWGSTTGRYWSTENGAVVCRELGLGPVVSVSYDSVYGSSSGTQYAGFRCSGVESSLSSCPWAWDPWETYRSGGSYDDDAGVVCSYDKSKCEVCTSGYATGYGNTNCTACPIGFEAIGPFSSDHNSSSSCKTCRTGTFGSYTFKNISRSNQYFTDGTNAIVTIFDDSVCSSYSRGWTKPSQSKLPLGQCLLQSSGVYGKYTLASTQPTQQPTFQPTNPTSQPSRQPTSQPSLQPSRKPSSQPSSRPTNPTSQPSRQPSRQPTTQPSSQPTNPTSQPSRQPSRQPSCQPTGQPSSQPSLQPSLQPAGQPSSQPSLQPSLQPTAQPSRQPTLQPSLQPNSKPSSQPSRQPSSQPSLQPTSRPTSPTSQPSRQPSSQPSIRPTSQPTNICIGNNNLIILLQLIIHYYSIAGEYMQRGTSIH